MDSTVEKGIQALIKSLGLLVSLRMVQRTHEQLSIREAEELLPQGASENPTTVRDNGFRQTMQLVNVIQEQLSNLQGSKRMRKGYKVSIL